MTLDVFDVAAQAYNTGHRAAVAELGALSDTGRRLVDGVTPNAQAVNRITSTHRSILRTIDDRYRGIVAEVTTTPLTGPGTRPPGHAGRHAPLRRREDPQLHGPRRPTLAAHLLRLGPRLRLRRAGLAGRLVVDQQAACRASTNSVLGLRRVGRRAERSETKEAIAW